VVAGGGTVLRCPAAADMGLLAAGLAYDASSHAAQRLFKTYGKAGAVELRADGRCYMDRS